jgi:hypothetical protein
VTWQSLMIAGKNKVLPSQVSKRVSTQATIQDGASIRHAGRPPDASVSGQHEMGTRMANPPWLNTPNMVSWADPPAADFRGSVANAGLRIRCSVEFGVPYHANVCLLALVRCRRCHSDLPYWQAGQAEC